MTKYVDAGDADLEAEDYRAPNGSRVTEQIADAVTKRAVQRGRGGGRPSLTAPGRVSPTVNARVSLDVKQEMQRVAREAGVRESDLVRQAVEELLARAGGVKVTVSEPAVKAPKPTKAHKAAKTTGKTHRTAKTTAKATKSAAAQQRTADRTAGSR